MKMKKPHTAIQINATNVMVSESLTQRNTRYNYLYTKIEKEAKLHSSDLVCIVR